MDRNNSNYGRNPNFPNNSNFQFNQSNPPVDPNMLSNPQIQAAFIQWCSSQPRPKNFNNIPPIQPNFPQNSQSYQQSFGNTPFFPISEHLTQNMNQSPGGVCSSNATPIELSGEHFEDSAGAQHLEEIDNDEVEIVPEVQLNTSAQRKNQAWSIAEDKALVSAYINAGGDVERGTKTKRSGLWAEIHNQYEKARAENLNEIKLGTVHLCRSVIRSIETARIFDFEEFPPRDKVTYMYYTGRLEVFNEKFPAADQKLSYALAHCHPDHEANIRMILKYLIPVKLSIGILPGDLLLQKYNLLEYKDVVLALRRGDLRLLRSALQQHEDRFLRSGVYLVLEKLELQVYRRLLKKIYIIQKHKDPNKAHQVKLDVIVKALKWLQIDMDADEVECIVAILIYTNLIKGYFAHKSKVVVLSKQDPFPKQIGKPMDS